MKVLIGCEESQKVCNAFRTLGHEAYSCDIQECTGGHPEWHLRGDVFKYLVPGWDLIIAHPPCTYLSKAGARWLHGGGRINKSRFELGIKAKEFFMAMINAPCDKIAVENPTPLKIWGLPSPTQVIQPWQFGHPFSKRTLLWLKGLPPLVPTEIISQHRPFMPSNTGGAKRGQQHNRGVVSNAKDASKTFSGIAAAMADQWGGILYSDLW